MFDYLVPPYLSTYHTKIAPGFYNPGGGMRTKVASVLAALGEHGRVCSDVASLRRDFVLVEPLFFKRDDWGVLEDFINYSGIKILYSSEMQPLRWTGSFRNAVFNACDLITYDCDFQRDLWAGLRVRDMKPLVDPIDTDLFVPTPNPVITVVAVGRISEVKNSVFIRDLFHELRGISQVRTVYIGGCSLWGNVSKVDMSLEHEIRGVTDLFLGSVPIDEVAKHLGYSTFFVGANYHDMFSESHVESLSAGCISVCCGHPVFRERPGFFVKNMVGAVVEQIRELTSGFKKSPDSSLAESSRSWAIDNASYATFTRQLLDILSEWLEVGEYESLTNQFVYK